jgi:3-methyladenine DNA glycosylase Tag
MQIHKGLRALIEGETGQGLVNSDLGHPAYRMGAQGKLDQKTWGDSPKTNTLFQMLSEISKELKKRNVHEMGEMWWYDFSDWQQFCQFVIDIYDGKMEKQHIK